MRKIILIITLLFIPVFSHAKEPALAEVLEWKYGSAADTKEENGKIIISGWRSDTPKPNENQIALDTDEYKAFLIQKEKSEKSQEDAIKVKLNLSDEEIEIIKRILNK